MKRALIAKGQIIPQSAGNDVELASVFCGGKTKTVSAERLELALEKGIQGTSGKRVPSGVETSKALWLVFHTDTDNYKSARELIPNAELYPAEAAIRAAVLDSGVTLPAIVVERAGDDLMCVSINEDGMPGSAMLIAPAADALERFFSTCQEEDKIWPSTVIFSFEPGDLAELQDVKQANLVRVTEKVALKGLEHLPKTSQLMLGEERANLRKARSAQIRRRSTMLAACLSAIMLGTALLMGFWGTQNESEARSLMAKTANLQKRTVEREVKIFWDRLQKNNHLYAEPLKTVFDNMPPRWGLYGFSGDSSQMTIQVGPVPKDNLLPEERVLLERALDKVETRYKIQPFKNGYRVVIKLPKPKDS